MGDITRTWSSWSSTDLQILYKRPRIDHRVSEYVIEHINKNILRPKNINILNLEQGCPSINIVLMFSPMYKYDQKKREFSQYDTKYRKYDFFITKEYGGNYIFNHFLCFSTETEINENMKPREYANIIYEMIGAYLIRRYKRITKDVIDKNRTEMNYSYVENFRWPSPFEDQKYYEDTHGIWNWEMAKNERNTKGEGMIEFTKEARLDGEYIKEKYVEHYRD